jgi:hypothetical protein
VKPGKKAMALHRRSRGSRASIVALGSAGGSRNQIIDHTGELAFVAVETGNHRPQHFVRLQFFDFERVARVVGQQGEERKLRPSISFAEGMDRIQLCQEMRSLVCEPQRIEIRRKSADRKPSNSLFAWSSMFSGKQNGLPPFAILTVRICPAH